MAIEGTHVLSRRALLALSGTGSALLAASMSGCSFFSTDPEQESGAETGEGAAAAQEAPALADQVAAGELEPLESRLPAEPLVVEVPSPGSYGGTWKSVTLGPGDEAAFVRIAGYQPPLRKSPMLTETVPNLCTDIEVSEDGTEFTLLLRKGVRWSDGEPLTADDLIFTVEEVFGNEELNPAPPSWLSDSEGNPAQVRRIDDFTVKIIFAAPNGLFREWMARYTDLVDYPKHYLSKFMPQHNENLDRDAKDAGFGSWTEYFGSKASTWGNPDLPVLNPWMVVEPLGEGQRVVLERNPYFWKTDPDGRQLPYIDQLSWEVVTDGEVQLLKTTDGELDLAYRNVNIPKNKPVLAKSSESGGYQLINNVVTHLNTMCIELNLANKDSARRELYQKKDFRIGLSHAINRDELITAAWQRQGEPWQAAPTKDSIFFDEEFAKQYTDFDLDLANRHLNAAGITERDDQGYRTLPSGKRLTITLDVATALSPEWQAAADMIRGMWKKVGIRLQVNTIDRTLFYERKAASANEHDAGTWFGPAGYATEIQDPRCYMPYSDESIWATPWAQWFATRGKAGTEPIAAAREQIELYWKLTETPDDKQREQLFRQILAIAKQEFWIIGIGTYPPPFMAVSNRLHNVTENIPETAVYNTPAHANPETWYLDGTS